MSGKLSRRDLLVGAGAAALALRIPTRVLAAETQQDLGDWEAVRRLFDLDPSKVHMAGLLLATHPKPVRDAIERHRKALDKNPNDYYMEYEWRGENDVRVAGAAFLNAKPAEIALTDSTTMGLAMMYNGIKLKPDQEILVTKHDHPSTLQSIALRSAKTGNKVRAIGLYDDAAKATVDQITGAIAKEIRPETRVLAVTYVHSSTGMRLPIGAIAEVVKKANENRDISDRLLLCVDAVHGFASTLIDTATFGADAFSAGCHKWLFGPRGTGILWARRDIQWQIQPTIPTFGNANDWSNALTPGGFHSFEHRWALKEAFELHRALDTKRVEARIHELNRHAKEDMAKMPKVKLYTPMSDELSAGLICFDIEGMDQNQVVGALAERKVIASTTPYRDSYARITPGLWNSSGDVEQTLIAIRELAA